MNYRHLSWVFGAILLSLLAVSLSLQVLGTLVVSIFFYYSVRPAYNRLDAHIPTKNIPAALSILFFIVPVVFILVYTALVGVHELVLFANTVDVGAVNTLLNSVLAELNTDALAQISPSRIFKEPSILLTGPMSNFVLPIIRIVLSYAESITNILLHSFLSLAITFYLLRDGDSFTGSLERTFSPSETTREFFSRVDRSLHYVFFGNVLNAFLTAIVGAISFYSIELLVPGGTGYPVLIGVLCGVGSLIPIVGMKIVYIPISISLFVVGVINGNSDLIFFTTVFTVVAATIVDIIPDLFLRPFVSGRTTHVGSLMIAYVIGPLLFGWYGLFLAPLLLVVGIEFYNTILQELVDGPVKQTIITRFN